MNSIVLKRGKGKLATKDIETIKRFIFHCYSKLPFCLLSLQHFISHQLRQLGKTSHCTNRCRLSQIAWSCSMDRDLFFAAPQVLCMLQAGNMTFFFPFCIHQVATSVLFRADCLTPLSFIQIIYMRQIKSEAHVPISTDKQEESCILRRKLIIVLVRCCKQVIRLPSLIKHRAAIIALGSLYGQDLYFLDTKAMGLNTA